MYKAGGYAQITSGRLWVGVTSDHSDGLVGLGLEAEER